MALQYLSKWAMKIIVNIIAYSVAIYFYYGETAKGFGIWNLPIWIGVFCFTMGLNYLSIRKEYKKLIDGTHPDMKESRT